MTEEDCIKHHGRMDELLDTFRENCHKSLDRVITQGAMDFEKPEMSPDYFWVARIVLEACAREISFCRGKFKDKVANIAYFV